MRALLITGGAGFIGSNFIRYALREHPDWRIANLDKLTYAGTLANLKDVEGDPRYRFVKGDIADRKLVDQLFREDHFDVVINFAAESHVDRSILDPSPFFETNVKGCQVLLEGARQYGVERFIQISTDEVYGSLGKSGKFTEASPLNPNSPYAASKAAADLLCRAYFKTYGLPVIITRGSNTYGPYQFPEKLIPFMIWNILHSQPLPVYGTGENVRDWLYVEDHCRAIALLIERGNIGDVYNIGGGEEQSNIDLVRLLCRLLAERLEKPYEELERLITFIKDRPGHDFRYALDFQKIKEELGWQPSIPLKEGLRRTIDWYMDHQDWMEQVISSSQEYYIRVYKCGWQ